MKLAELERKWGIGYLCSNGEIIEVRNNLSEIPLNRVARFYYKSKNGYPSLEGKGQLYVEIMTDNKESIFSAVKTLENINEKEMKFISSKLEKMLYNGSKVYSTKSKEWLSKGSFYIDRNGKKTDSKNEWVAKYDNSKGTVKLEINPNLDPNYDFSMVSSAMHGIRDIKINLIKELCSKLKSYLG